MALLNPMEDPLLIPSSPCVAYADIPDLGAVVMASCSLPRAARPPAARPAEPRGHAGQFGGLLIELRAVVCGAWRGEAAVVCASVPRVCSSGEMSAHNPGGAPTSLCSLFSSLRRCTPTALDGNT